MIIEATQDFKKVIFQWNEDLTECNYSALGVTDEEVETLIDAKVNEGVDLEGWEVKIF